MKRLATLPVFQSTADRCTSFTPEKAKDRPPLHARRKTRDDSNESWMLRLLDEQNTVLYESDDAPISTAHKSPTIAFLLSQKAAANKTKTISMPDWTLSILDDEEKTNQIDLQSTFSPQTAAHVPVIAHFVWSIIEAQADEKQNTLPTPCNDLTALDLIASIRILRRLGYYGATVPLEKTLTKALEREYRSLDDETMLYLTQIAYCDGLPYVWRFLRSNNAYKRIAALGTKEAADVIEQWDEQGAPTREASSTTAAFVDQSQFFWVRDVEGEDDDEEEDENDNTTSRRRKKKSGRTRDGGKWLDAATTANLCSTSALCAKDADACLLCKQTLAKALVWSLMYGDAPDETLAKLRSQSAVKEFEASYTAKADRWLVLRYDGDEGMEESINSCANNVDRRSFARNLTVTIGRGKPSALQFVTITDDRGADDSSVQWPLKSLYEWFCIMLWQHSTLVIDVSGASRTAKRFYTTVSSNVPPLKSSTDKSDWVIVPLDASAVHMTSQHHVWFEQFANAVKTLGLRVVDAVDVPDTCLFW
jgi:hypothetical protein